MDQLWGDVKLLPRPQFQLEVEVQESNSTAVAPVAPSKRRKTDSNNKRNSKDDGDSCTVTRPSRHITGSASPLVCDASDFWFLHSPGYAKIVKSFPCSHVNGVATTHPVPVVQPISAASSSPLVPSTLLAPTPSVPSTPSDASALLASSTPSASSPLPDSDLPSSIVPDKDINIPIFDLPELNLDFGVDASTIPHYIFERFFERDFSRNSLDLLASPNDLKITQADTATSPPHGSTTNTSHVSPPAQSTCPPTVRQLMRKTPIQLPPMQHILAYQATIQGVEEREHVYYHTANCMFSGMPNFAHDNTHHCPTQKSVPKHIQHNIQQSFPRVMDELKRGEVGINAALSERLQMFYAQDFIDGLHTFRPGEESPGCDYENELEGIRSLGESLLKKDAEKAKGSLNTNVSTENKIPGFDKLQTCPLFTAAINNIFCNRVKELGAEFSAIGKLFIPKYSLLSGVVAETRQMELASIQRRIEIYRMIPYKLFDIGRLDPRNLMYPGQWKYCELVRDINNSGLSSILKYFLYMEADKAQCASMRGDGYHDMAERVDFLDRSASKQMRIGNTLEAHNLRMAANDYRSGAVGFPRDGHCTLYYAGVSLGEFPYVGLEKRIRELRLDLDGPIWREDGDQLVVEGDQCQFVPVVLWSV
ncbi:hypothetical protein TWF481_011118 [Arthrobotrys musiformis]|uniref:Uncharacterized protein n=1 Tax=Arthrobotrys musiformis TaxID=47236 RepID=A0AAV9VZU7_9PEZI